MANLNPFLVPFLGFVAWLAGCSTASVVPQTGGAAFARVTGTVTYRERIALAPDAIVKVQLVDVSRADAPLVVAIDRPLCGTTDFRCGSVFTVRGPQSDAGFPSLPGAEGERTDG